MVATSWAATALVAFLSLSTGVIAVPANYKPDPDQIKEKKRQILATINTARTLDPFTRSLTLATIRTTASLRTTTRSTTPVYTPPYTTSVYTPPYTPPYTTPAYTPPYTTPGYGYTPPWTSTTTTRLPTTSTRPTATPSYTPVVGANSTCYNRLKIDTMSRTDPDQLNLLLVAWAHIMSTGEFDTFGYYQIAAIHGAPYIPWQMPNGGAYDYGRGYCTHGSVLFTTWHRPYLLLLEQALFNAAHLIANQFNPTYRATYLAIAARVRLPYWDWSDPTSQSYLPQLTMQQNVLVTRPDGSGNPVSVSIVNPLWTYRFPSTSSISTFGSLSNRMNTRRYPDNLWNDNSPIASNQMQNGFTNRYAQTYNAFMSSTYNTFSNRVEGIHDSIHGAIGGGGHMGYVAYSSYDPIFWLHHCNVDRLMAMFQAANPSLWLTPAPAVGTFARPVPPNTIDDNNSELYPFRRADGSWWRSAHTTPVSTIWASRYGYPEVPCSYQGRTQQELDAFTTQQINTLYGRGRTPIPVGVTRDFQARLIIDQAEIGGGYDIYVYGGYNEPRPSDPYSDPYRPGYLGSLSSMAMSSTDMYKPSRIRYIDIPLNPYLYETGYNPSYNPYEVTEYITRDIYYTIIANGRPCRFSDLYTAKIAVYSREIYNPGKPDVTPYYVSEPHYYLNVTSKIEGGAKSIEDILYPVRVDGSREQPWADLNSTYTQTTIRPSPSATASAQPTIVLGTTATFDRVQTTRVAAQP